LAAEIDDDVGKENYFKKLQNYPHQNTGKTKLRLVNLLYIWTIKK
jgi:hypothetical protein